jgi:ribonuclease BN (tRNA processing enzyme)
MKLILLGTGGYYANDHRHTACLMLPEIGVVLDAGSGMFRLREYVTTDRLEIFLSHAHLDHVIGLTYLIDMIPPDQLMSVAVYGDPAKIAAVREHLFDNALFPVPPSFQLEPLATSHALADGGTLTHFPLKHPGGSVGFRLDWPGRSLAYVTDTTAAPDSDYIERIRGVDLLLHEANFSDDAKDMAELTGHSWLSSVAQVAANAQVGRLVLVHINAQLQRDDELDVDCMRKVFKNVEIGCDRMELEF